jgi:hypothetical protein
VALGADVIAGFPTESAAAFARTLAHVEALDLPHLHVFPFSARAGTPAARMPQVPHGAVRERAARLRAAVPPPARASRAGSRAPWRRCWSSATAAPAIARISSRCGSTAPYRPARSSPRAIADDDTGALHGAVDATVAA